MKTYFFLSFCLLRFFSVSYAETEKIINGEFDQSIDPWQVNNWSGGSGSIIYSIDSAGKISGANSVQLNVVQITDQWWNLNMRQLFTVAENGCYEVSYYAIANQECQIQVLLQNSNYPYETFVYPVQTIGTQAMRFTTSGLANFTGIGQLMFAVGKTTSGTTIWIDKVSVTEQLPPSGIPTVTVDFNELENVKPMNGLLLGLLESDPVGGPPEQLFIDSVKPAYWRVRPESVWVSRAGDSGAIPICILSEGWYPCEPLSNPITPWQDNYVAWDAYVRAKAEEFGTGVVYDIWNEPDWKPFFMNWPDADFDKFLETFKHAHDVIRSELGIAAIISGPSLSESISPWKLRRFMDYCRSNNLTVQVLSLHMLDREDGELNLMQNDLLGLRTDFIDNPAYSSVGVNQIHVNEYACDNLQSYRPGSILTFMRTMELSGVDAACKACWSHPDCNDCSTCWDGSVDGILTEGGLLPRAAWWAYKWYADGLESRVRAFSDDWSVCPVASFQSQQPHTAQILLASNGCWGQSHNKPSVNILLKNINKISFLNSGTERLAITVDKLNYSDPNASAALASPEVVEQFVIDINEGSAQFSIINLQPYQVQKIVIQDHYALFSKLLLLADNWLNECNLPCWCDFADLDYSGSVDFFDLAYLGQIWLAE